MASQGFLQQAAVAANVREPGKKLRVGLSLTRAIQKPLQSIERPALVHLKIGVQIVGEGKIRVQA